MKKNPKNEHVANIIIDPPKPRPVRIMEPEFLLKFLSRREIDQKAIKRLVRIIEQYTRACNKAAEKMEVKLKKF
jgi:hypothetical protein